MGFSTSSKNVSPLFNGGGVQSSGILNNEISRYPDFSNHNIIPSQIMHNCMLLLLVSILYLICYGSFIIKIIYFIPPNITVTLQSFILLVVDVIDVEVPRVLENIQWNFSLWGSSSSFSPLLISPSYKGDLWESSPYDSMHSSSSE